MYENKNNTVKNKNNVRTIERQNQKKLRTSGSY